MNKTLDLNDLLILENELKIILVISEYTKNQYSEINRDRYDFVVSQCLYKDAKIKEVKEAPLSGRLAHSLLNRVGSSVFGSNQRAINAAIKNFELECTPNVLETLTHITNLMEKYINISNVILLQKLLTKGFDKLKQKECE